MNLQLQVLHKYGMIMEAVVIYTSVFLIRCICNVRQCPPMSVNVRVRFDSESYSHLCWQEPYPLPQGSASNIRPGLGAPTYRVGVLRQC